MERELHAYNGHDMTVIVAAKHATLPFAEHDHAGFPVPCGTQLPRMAPRLRRGRFGAALTAAPTRREFSCEHRAHSDGEEQRWRH